MYSVASYDSQVLSRRQPAKAVPACILLDYAGDNSQLGFDGSAALITVERALVSSCCVGLNSFSACMRCQRCAVRTARPCTRHEEIA
jgi:hypothetical protein